MLSYASAWLSDALTLNYVQAFLPLWPVHNACVIFVKIRLKQNHDICWVWGLNVPGMLIKTASTFVR